MTPERMEHYEKPLPQVSTQASERERRAEEAETGDSEAEKKVEYGTKRHIGERIRKGDPRHCQNGALM